MFWRPFTAIPGAADDGNDATVADAAWKPLLATPSHPEYPSAHSCITPSAGLVLSKFLGTDQIDLTLSSTVTADTMPTRTYATVEDLASEVMEARILGGIHYRNSTKVGRSASRSPHGRSSATSSQCLDHSVLNSSRGAREAGHQARLSACPPRRSGRHESQGCAEARRLRW